ncbi:MAG: hypothetical protein LBT84_04605, partial [Spirochaetia bacterium]|nr:hypothetical protein [Spirochaetia bacterium]
YCFEKKLTDGFEVLQMQGGRLVVERGYYFQTLTKTGLDYLFPESKGVVWGLLKRIFGKFVAGG